jgi:prepilin-type N-terminal cleavage/methylation domain-containing protein
MSRRALPRGFSVIELMVTIAIAALMMVLALPYFGKATKQAQERRVKQQLVQDITWARGAAGAADQSSLDSSLASGTTPSVTLTINADCTWTTKIGTATNAAHTLASTPTTMSCAAAASGGLPVGTAISFTPQGFAKKAGTLIMTGTTQTYQLQLLYSGSVLETHATSGVDS